jgi:hypothetical protein
MATFSDVANELARQKLRLEKMTKPADVRSELANSVYPLMAMVNEAISETLVALTRAIEERMSELEQALTDVGDMLEDSEPDDTGLDDEFVLALVSRCQALVDGLADHPEALALARQIRDELKSLIDSDAEPDAAKLPAQAAKEANA